MKINYNVEKLRRILEGFSDLTGVNMAFLDSEFNCLVSPKNNNEYCRKIQKCKETHGKCAKCDREIIEKCKKSLEFESHICHAGLYDAVLPIIKGNEPLGFVIMGQIRSPLSPETPPRFKEEYEKLPRFGDEKISGLRSLLSVILFETAVTTESSGTAEEIAEYIGSRLVCGIRLSELCDEFHISKNTLYRKFYERYKKTPLEYLGDRRLEKAKELLLNSSLSVSEIAEKVGIGEYAYFCRFFKLKTGTTPSKFRKFSKTG